MNEIVEIMTTSEITIRSPFKDFFSINPIILGSIEDDMRKYGYDASAPIRVWEKGNVVIDGHTRLQAAKNIGLKEGFVCRFEFDDEKEAVDYAIHNQRDRRNLTDAEIFRCVEAVDKKIGRWPQNQDIKVQLNFDSKDIDIIEDAKKSYILSCDKTAKTIGIAPSAVKRARVILDSNNEQIKQEVRKGEKSIHAASEEIKKEKSKDKPIEARINMASNKFEKDLKKAINKAIESGLTILQLKQIVNRLLQEGS